MQRSSPGFPGLTTLNPEDAIGPVAALAHLIPSTVASGSTKIFRADLTDQRRLKKSLFSQTSPEVRIIPGMAAR